MLDVGVGEAREEYFLFRENRHEKGQNAQKGQKNGQKSAL